MKASELRDKSVDELNKQLLTLREEQFKLRMQKSTGQLGQTHLLQQNQRFIKLGTQLCRIFGRLADLC